MRISLSLVWKGTDELDVLYGLNSWLGVFSFCSPGFICVCGGGGGVWSIGICVVFWAVKVRLALGYRAVCPSRQTLGACINAAPPCGFLFFYFFGQ